MVYYAPHQLDAIYAALGEPTRRAMIERLAIADATVSELAAPFAMSLQAVGKHIRVLEDAGLVRRTRIGRANHLALVPDALQAAAGWLNARTPAGAPPVRLALAAERRTDLWTRAEALRQTLQPRMSLFRQALEAQPPNSDDFAPADATIRALQASVDRRPTMVEALRLYEALTRHLEGQADSADVDALREIILPLGRVMYDLRPLLRAA